jgi:phosphatidylglycerophosphate synthase
MQPWWNFVVELMPMWIAPNLITIIGLAVNVFTSLVLLYYAPTATEEVPMWVPLGCALGLFIYQTLDAIDGKQARRTKSSNALGELFDHGCDSMSTIFVSLAGACTMGMGHIQYFMMFQCLTASTLFYLAHWQTYVTGQMKFGKFDVTEAQICMMVMMSISGLFGTSFWNWPVFGFLPLRWIPLIFATVVSFLSLPTTINNILFGGAGKNGSSVADTSVIGPIQPLLCFLVPAIYLAANSKEQLYEQNPILYIFVFGIIGSKITNKLIVAQMTKSEFDTLDSSYLAPVALFANQYFNTIFSERKLLWLCWIFVTFDLLWYCSNVCLEICNATGWYLFKINQTTTNASSAATTSTNSNSTQKKNR